MANAIETVHGACNRCGYVGKMRRVDGFLRHNLPGTDRECDYGGAEVKGYGIFSGEPISEYLAKFAEEENAGLVSYHADLSPLPNIQKSTNVDHEAKAREVWRQHGHLTRDHMHDGNVVAFISAIASALREAEAGEREACAKIAKEFADEFDPESAEACVAMEINTEIEARKQLTCDHDWIDARNQAVQSGEYCGKCFVLRAGNQSTDAAASRSTTDE